jgi:hypothetical protein
MDLMFNTSTEAYPVTSSSNAAALEGVSPEGLTVTSVIRIKMQGVSDAKMEAVWLQSLALRATEGDLKFLQLARCYVQSGTDRSHLIQVGTAKADGIASDGKSFKFQVDRSQDVAEIIRSPFYIVVEIEGDSPSGKTSVSAELTFKAHVGM